MPSLFDCHQSDGSLLIYSLSVGVIKKQKRKKLLSDALYFKWACLRATALQGQNPLRIQQDGVLFHSLLKVYTIKAFFGGDCFSVSVIDLI